MQKSYLPQADVQLNNFVDFKPAESKEIKSSEGSAKIEVDVTVLCINCIQGLLYRDIEEIRMFEYSFAYHCHLLSCARTKIAQNAEASRVVPPFGGGSGVSQSFPPIVSNTYVIPPPQQSQNLFRPPQQPIISSSIFANPVSSQPQSFWGTPAVTTTQAQPFNFGLNQQPTQPTFPITSLPQPAQSLSSVWNSNISQQPSATTQSSGPPVPVYPGSHLGAAFPPYQPPSYYGYPRYYPFGDPYVGMRPSYGCDPFPYLYRDYDFFDSSKEAIYMQKALMQRQAAQMLWYRYGIDPSLPLTTNFLEKEVSSRRRPKDTFYQSKLPSQDATIHVVPTLAGFKDGKQQIVLNIEETPQNRAYIPKIFNPNSEISFTITSKDTSASRSFLASIGDDAIDEAIPENIRIGSPTLKNNDLPRPILSKKMSTHKKSILDMDLSDYNIVPKNDRSFVGSADRRKVTFQNEVENLLHDGSKELSNLEFSRANSENIKTSFTKGSSFNYGIEPDTSIMISPSDYSKEGKLGGTLNSYVEGSPFSGLPKNTVLSTASSKWTTSWFISKFKGYFSNSEPPLSPITPVTSLPQQKYNCCLTLTREGYYTRPSRDELDSMTKDGHCFVKDFVVGKYDTGKILFKGIIDVYGLNLDQIVFINPLEIEVYPDFDSHIQKPPVGVGLNRPAILTLYNVFPLDEKGTPQPEFDQDTLAEFELYLRSKAEDLGARFINYHSDLGSFCFEVEHFTRYGLEHTELLNASRSNLSTACCNSVPFLDLASERPNVSECIVSTVSDCSSSKFQFPILPSRFNFNSFLNSYEHYIHNCFANWLPLYEILVHSHAVSLILTPSQTIPLKLRANNQSVKILKIIGKNGSDFLDQTNLELAHPIFRMIHSLWVISDTFSLGDLDTQQISRKKHFLKWISNTFSKSSRSISAELVLKNRYFDAALELISCNLLEEAVSLLCKFNNPCLAAILCNCIDNPSLSNEMAVQLDLWISKDIYKYMDPGFLKLCMLIARIFVIEFENSSKILHTCEGLDWLKAFSLFLIFSNDDDPLSNVFQTFTSHFKEYPQHVQPPFASQKNSSTLDFFYYIIKYLSLTDTDHTKMFETDSYTENPLDYSLSWHVFKLLELIKPSNHFIESSLCLNYANQLESLGNWQFSVFVLLFHKDDVLRSQRINQIFLRHVNEIDNYTSFFQSLKISSNLIHSSKAIFFQYIGESEKTLDELIASNDFENAHKFSLKNVIPQLFVQTKYQELFNLLSKFESSTLSSNSFYLNNGKIYFDFLCNRSKSESVDCSFTDLLKKLLLMEAATPYQILARSIIAEECLSKITPSSKDFNSILELLHSNQILDSETIEKHILQQSVLIS